MPLHLKRDLLEEKITKKHCHGVWPCTDSICCSILANTPRLDLFKRDLLKSKSVDQLMNWLMGIRHEFDWLFPGICWSQFDPVSKRLHSYTSKSGTSNFRGFQAWHTIGNDLQDFEITYPRFHVFWIYNVVFSMSPSWGHVLDFALPLCGKSSNVQASEIPDLWQCLIDYGTTYCWWKKSCTTWDV